MTRPLLLALLLLEAHRQFVHSTFGRRPGFYGSTVKGAA